MLPGFACLTPHLDRLLEPEQRQHDPAEGDRFQNPLYPERGETPAGAVEIAGVKMSGG